MTNIDNAATLRILVVLKLLIDEPNVHSRKSLAERIGVHVDTVKGYFAMIRQVGFDLKHSDYPDYVYFINNIDGFRYNTNKNEMKINQSFLTQYSSKRHVNSKDLFLTVYRNGRVLLSNKFVNLFEIQTMSKVGFELKETEKQLYLNVGKQEDFEIRKSNGFYPQLFISSISLIRYLYEFFGMTTEKTPSFKVSIEEVDKDLYRLALKK